MNNEGCLNSTQDTTYTCGQAFSTPPMHCKCAQTFLLLLRRFKGCPVIAVAAKPGGPEAPDTEEAQGISDLIEVSKWALCSQQHIKNRDRFKWRSKKPAITLTIKIINLNGRF